MASPTPAAPSFASRHETGQYVYRSSSLALTGKGLPLESR